MLDEVEVMDCLIPESFCQPVQKNLLLEFDIFSAETLRTEISPHVLLEAKSFCIGLRTVAEALVFRILYVLCV